MRQRAGSMLTWLAIWAAVLPAVARAGEGAAPAVLAGAPVNGSRVAEAGEPIRAAALAPTDAAVSGSRAGEPIRAAALAQADGTVSGSTSTTPSTVPSADTPLLPAPPGPPEPSLDAGANATTRPPRHVRGVFVGDELRYPRFGLLPGIALRTLLDLVAIPSGIPGWTASDFAVAATIVGLTAALSVSVRGPSLDVLIQERFEKALGGPDHFLLWTPYGDFVIWAGIWAMTASIFTYGIATEQPRYVETAALMVEAFAVTQILHLGIKLLTGRQGPKDEDGQGYYGGPAYFFRYFPSGTPSGHVATMYALFSALMTYWDNPVLNVALSSAALVFTATIIADNYHYASDVILGAALGYCVGRWVVHHRSSRYHNGDDGQVHPWDQLTVTPAIVPGGGMGIAASVRF